LAWTSRGTAEAVNCLNFAVAESLPASRRRIGSWLSRDPLGEKAGINVYEYVGDDPINYNDPEGLEAPNYNPGAWNDNGTIQFSNNCYSYACNRPGPRKAPNKPQPGDSSGHPFSDPGNCAQVKAAAMSDGLKEPGKNGKCPCHFHLVKLYTSHNWNGSGSPDYHWYRQDSNGRWSSKHGWAPVGPQVDDPDADAKVTGYDNPPDRTHEVGPPRMRV